MVINEVSPPSSATSFTLVFASSNASLHCRQVRSEGLATVHGKEKATLQAALQAAQAAAHAAEAVIADVCHTAALNAERTKQEHNLAVVQSPVNW